MSQLAYRRALAHRSPLLTQLAEMFRASPLAIFVAALQARR